MAIPTYSIQSTLLLVGVCNKIDQVVKRFLWDKSPNKVGIPLVRWDKVMCNKEHGGLGIKNTTCH